MNSLAQIGKQLTDLFNSLTPSARIMAGLMLGVIVVSLGWVVSSETSGKYESLLGGVTLTNTELDRIETAFGDAQLRDYERIGKQIKIPSGEKDQYLKALSAAGALPKQWGAEMDRALAEGNVFESTEKFSARMQTGEERELANILKRMPGIEFAAVRVDDAKKGFAKQTERVCSVQLQSAFNDPVPEATLKRIAEHVSTYFAGLPLANISVMDLGTANLYHHNDDPSSASENPVLAARQEWEKYLEQKIGAILKGYGAVELLVNVNIDPTLSEEIEKLQYDPTAVTLQSIESRKDSENSKPSPGGPPGSDINGIGNKSQSIASTSAPQSSKTKESEANEQRVAGHDAMRKKNAGLSVTKVNVSIGIPESHYREVFAHRQRVANPDTKPDEIQPVTAQELVELRTEVETSIRAAVEGITVGIRDGDDPKPYVTLYTFTDLPTPEFPQPTLAENSLVWLGESWSTLGLMALVLVSLGMMFSWVKSQGGAEPDRNFKEGFGLLVPEDMGDELELSSDEADEGGGTAKRRKPEFEVSGGEMKEDLSTLIKDNPDAVVNLLKTWIGDAA